jgi:hypothetical protein
MDEVMCAPRRRRNGILQRQYSAALRAEGHGQSFSGSETSNPVSNLEPFDTRDVDSVRKASFALSQSFEGRPPTSKKTYADIRLRIWGLGVRVSPGAPSSCIAAQGGLGGRPSSRAMSFPDRPTLSPRVVQKHRRSPRREDARDLSARRPRRMFARCP